VTTQEDGLRPTEPATPDARRHGDDDKLAPGTLVDRYEILEALGSGGMGVVYEARDTRLGRLVGLKLMRPHRDPDAAEIRLLREAQAMARISHPNVMTIYDVGTFEGRLYYAMELVEGGTLREWLKERPRSQREIIDVFRQAARGLAAAHSAGLVHHDFKPENLLVSSDGRVRVADFGLVGLTPEHRSPSPSPNDALSAEEQPNAVIGTPGYMAPEQILGQATDARADQFGFCVALCEALYGEGPFRAAVKTDVETRVMVMAAVLSGTVRLPEGKRVPGWLRRIILRGLSLDPDARWPSLDVVARLLDRGLNRRRRIGLAAAAGVLVASAAAVAMVPRDERTSMSEWRPDVIGVESEGNPARDGTSSKDGRLLAFSSRRAIWTQRRGTAERVPVPLPKGAYDLFTQRLSHGGERLFFVLNPLHESGSEVWRVELPSGTPERIYSPPGVLCLYFDVAADGQTLALVEQDDKASQFRLRLVAAGQTGRTLVEPEPGDVITSPTISPGGRRVAFVRSSPSMAASLEWVDVATGKRTQVGPARRFGVVEWSADDTLLLVVAGPDGGPRVREIVVADDGSIRRQRDVYRVPPDVDLWRIEATKAGVFIQRGPADGRLRVALLPLDAPKLRVLPTGSEVDRHAAGWMPDGDMVLAARVGGQDAVVTGTPEKGFKVAGTFGDLGEPLWIMGDRVFYRRPGDTPETFTLAVGGLSPPVTPLTQLSQSARVYCAGGRAEPCVLAEPMGKDTIAYEWDPRTGKRGRDVLRWEGYPKSVSALSPDGKTLAFIDGKRSVSTLSLSGGAPRELTPASAYTHHELAWTSDGAVLATRCCFPELVRIDPDGKSTVVMEMGTQWLGDPVVSPDGKTVAVSVNDMAHTYLWVANRK